MLNYDGTVGAVGRVPDYHANGCCPPGSCASMWNGKCRCAAPMGFASNAGRTKRARRSAASPTRAGRDFEGYTKAAETEKKILRDVFKKGDVWFRTGDLMRRDEHGYFYFVDRIGDTFRWKGENVATSEVAEVLSAIPGIREANVYGVTVPGSGRARRHGGPGGGWRFRYQAWRSGWKAGSRPMRGRFSCGCHLKSRSPARSSSARSIWCRGLRSVDHSRSALLVRPRHAAL